MNRALLNAIEHARTIGITGHIHPDGDCVGSCMALYSYIRSVYPEKEVKVFLEEPADNLDVADGLDMIDSTFQAGKTAWDLFVILDCSSADRFSPAADLVAAAGKTFVVDHHMTNTNFADEGVILPDASSTCEVLYDLLDDALIDRTVATYLYLGIVHDTGVFRYPACTEHTMNIAGKMLCCYADPPAVCRAVKIYYFRYREKDFFDIRKEQPSAAEVDTVSYPSADLKYTWEHASARAGAFFYLQDSIAHTVT